MRRHHHHQNTKDKVEDSYTCFSPDPIRYPNVSDGFHSTWPHKPAVMHIRDWKTQDLYGVDLDRMQDPVTLQDWYPCSPAGCDKISVATGCGLEICQNCQGVCAPTCILHKPYLGHTIPVCLYCCQAHSRRKPYLLAASLWESGI